MGSSIAGDISRGADGPDPKIEVVDKGEANALGSGFEHRQWEFLRPEYLMFDIYIIYPLADALRTGKSPLIG